MKKTIRLAMLFKFYFCQMPKIYEYIGFVFLFFTNDHLPVHVHVRKGERESKCELIYDSSGLNLVWKKVKSKKQLTSVEMKTAGEFIHKHHLGIVHKWNRVFVFNEKVKCEKINKL